ncbi:MAG: HDIG domain-containing metalloprotein, partial [Verrucomicrobiota bacterium]
RRRGFSSGKKRRMPKESQLSYLLKTGWQVRSALFVVFAALVSLWIVLASSDGSIFDNSPLQATVVVAFITAVIAVHWHVSLPQTFYQNSSIALMLTVILLQLMLVKLSAYVATVFAPTGGFRFLVEPYVFAPILLCLLIGRRHGTFGVVYASLFGGMTVASFESFHFVIFSMICGFVAIYLTNRVRRRSRLVSAGAYAGVTCALLAFTLGQVVWPGFGASATEWEFLGKQVLSAILVSTLVAVIVSGVLPLLESLFRITTDVSWIEMADLNHPLLKRMTIEAPGTYHHSLVVATLAETAAESIGANAIQCRVCSYFHDIGKMNKPAYFVENIGDGMNPHDELTPNMSALIVMAHVKDGVDMGIKHKLNPAIVDVIREHHGTSLIKFFYARALKQRDEIERQVEEGNAHEEDIPEIKESSFRYAGPRPMTRESAIISLADSVESASRTLQKPTPKKIRELIEGIFQDRLQDGQLDDAALTLADLAIIKESFAKTLRSMMHTRIEYPKIDEDAERQGKKAKTKKLAKGAVDKAPLPERDPAKVG